MRRTPPASQPSREPGIPQPEPLTKVEIVTGLILLALVIGVLVVLVATGHGVAAFVVLLVLAIAGLALYLGSDR